jgi:hypothetical protein
VSFGSLCKNVNWVIREEKEAYLYSLFTGPAFKNDVFNCGLIYELFKES